MLLKCVSILLFERLTQLKNAFDPSSLVLECADIRETGNCHKYYVYNWEIPKSSDSGAEITGVSTCKLDNYENGSPFCAADRHIKC